MRAVVRGSLLAIAALHIVSILFWRAMLNGPQRAANFTGFSPFLLLGGLVAILLALSLGVKRGGIALGLAWAFGIIFGYGDADVAGLAGALAWATFTVAIFAMEGRPQELAVGSVVVWGLVAAPALLFERYDLSSGWYNPPPALVIGGILFAEFVFAAAVIWGAAAAPRGAAAPKLSLPPAGAAPAMGSLILAISWLSGGSWSFIPLWPLGVLLLVIPAVRIRHVPWAAALLVAVLVIGYIDIGTCTTSGLIDDGTRYNSQQDVTLMQAGGNGPWWSSGDGMSSGTTACPPSVAWLGGGWALALVGASAWAARTSPRAQRSEA